MITVRRLTALGPAIGFSGAALGGPVTSFAVPAGAKVAAISARLRTRTLQEPVQSGSVLVQAAVVESSTLVLGAPADVDGIEDAPALWAGARYVSTARGARFMPGVIAMPEQSLCVAVRVWNRDTLDDSRRPTVDVTVTFCGPTEDVGGVESGHELGDFRPGTGTVRRVTGTNPDANVECSDGPGAGLMWDILLWVNLLVTDANAASRYVSLTRDTSAGGEGIGVAAAGNTQAASLTYYYQFCFGVGSPIGVTPVNGGAMIAGGARVRLMPGQTIETSISSRQAGDNWGAPAIEIEEWVHPQVAS